MSLKKYWDQAVSFDQYLLDSEKSIENLQNSSSEEDQMYLSYYELGLTRMNRVNKTYKPQEELREQLNSKNFNGKILIISEGWCGDAAMIVPVICNFFEGKSEVRITYRDQNDLINSYLTNGAKSIPVVILLDENFQEISHWGPRPEFGMDLLKKYKADPENYTVDDFHNDLQIYYTKNKGADIIKELLQKI